MMKTFLCLTAGFVVAAVTFAPADTRLPVIDVEYQVLREQCERLLQALDALKVQLPAGTEKTLKGLLRSGIKDSHTSVEKIQELLDPLCLIEVSINPESRVKAVRGPAKAELELDQEKVVLVKIHNEAGVCHPLKLAGLRVRQSREAKEEGWLEAEIYTKAPLRKALGGQKLEYVILRLTAREAGKREATLKFD